MTATPQTPPDAGWLQPPAASAWPQPTADPAWAQPVPPPQIPAGAAPREKKSGLRRLLDTPRKRIVAAIGAVVVLAAVVTLVVLTAMGPRQERASRVGSLESVDSTAGPDSDLDPLVVPTAPAAMMSPTPVPAAVPSPTATTTTTGSTAAVPAGTAQPPAASSAPEPPSDPKTHPVALSVSGGVIVASPSSLAARVGDTIVLNPSGFSLYDTLFRVNGGVERSGLDKWKVTGKGTATILAYIAGGTPEATILTVSAK